MKRLRRNSARRSLCGAVLTGIEKWPLHPNGKSLHKLKLQRLFFVR